MPWSVKRENHLFISSLDWVLGLTVSSSKRVVTAYGVCLLLSTYGLWERET